jgi:hypothetical protein
MSQTETISPARARLEQAQHELQVADATLGSLMQQLKVELPTAIRLAQQRFSSALAQVARCKDAVVREEKECSITY